MKAQKGHSWINKKIKTILSGSEELLIMIIRENDILIPNGDTVIKEEDLLIMSEEDIEKP